jgi:hypothetical protein
VVPFLALYLALPIPLQTDQEFPAMLEDITALPFLELLEHYDAANFSSADLKALRAQVQQQRDDAIDEARNLESRWKKELAADRRDLEILNQSPEDTEESAQRRSSLHIEIAALERGIRDKAFEREQTIPAMYELRLARIWLAEHWPAKHAAILSEIEEGNRRDRPHGDIEDIGYRHLVTDPGKDVEIGERAVRQMTMGGWLPPQLPDEEVQAYIRKLAWKIATNSDLKVPLRVTVLDSKEPKAIALPGGFLYISSALIRLSETEAELAGMISREVARIAAGHATRPSKALWISRFFVPVSQVIASIFVGGPANPAAYYGIGYGLEGASSFLGRALDDANEKHQIEADQLGIQYAWKAGFDPKGIVSFIDTISGKRQSFITPEPPLHERMLHLFTEIQYLPPPQNSSADSTEFARIQQRLAP